MRALDSDLSATAGELRLALGAVMRRLRTEHGFPFAQGAVLGRLDRDGPQTASTLATAEGVRPQSIAQTIGDLEDAGLVERRPDPRDGRQFLVVLTARGRRALKDDRRHRDGWLAHAISSELTRGEQRILIAAVPLLRRVAES